MTAWCRNSMRILMPLATGTLALICTFFCWQTVLENDQQKFNQATQAEAVSMQKQITLDLESRVGALERMGLRIAFDPTMSQDEWKAGSQDFRRYFHDMLGTIVFTAEKKLLWVDIEQKPLPLELSKWKLNKVRLDVLDHAAETQASVISPFLNLVLGGEGFIIVVPVFSKGKLFRFVTTGIRSEQYFPKFSHKGYEFAIIENEKSVFSTISQDTKFDKKWGQDTEISYHGAAWKIRVLPTPEFLHASKTPLPKTILITGIIISLLLTSLMDLLMRVREEEQRVLQRSKELEAANQIAIAATNAKSEFLAHMSHEIRTPINSIVGMTKLLSETSLETEQKTFVNAISNSSNTLLSLINDILDISKVESGIVEIEKMPFRLGNLIAESKNVFEPLIADKGLTFHLIEDFDKDLYLIGDLRRIRQILDNLLSNALKFTAKGEITLLATTREKAKGNVLVEFIVSDTGVGISSRGLNKLFQKFSQADASISRQYGGTGLGLFISKRLTELMGGAISVSSELGTGSQFSFTILTKKAEAPAVTSEPPAPRKIKLLIAEDTEDIRLLLRRYLEDPMHELTFVENGAEAYEHFEKSKFDVIFMDMQMPIMDGETAVRKMREFEMMNGRRSTPVIALTSYSEKKDIERIMKAGCDQFLFKPVVKDQLVRMIQSVERR